MSIAIDPTRQLPTLSVHNTARSQTQQKKHKKQKNTTKADAQVRQQQCTEQEDIYTFQELPEKNSLTAASDLYHRKTMATKACRRSLCQSLWAWMQMSQTHFFFGHVQPDWCHTTPVKSVMKEGIFSFALSCDSLKHRDHKQHRGYGESFGFSLPSSCCRT